MLGWFGGMGFEGTITYFTQTMHMPMGAAFVAMTCEFLGGLGLITGALGRVGAFLVAGTLTVQMFTQHLQNGFFMNWFFNTQPGEGM